MDKDLRIWSHSFPFKPISANKLTGRNKTFMTKEYKELRNKVYEELKNTPWPFEKHEKLSIEIHAYLSNRRSDLDNIFKGQLDALQNVYEDFDDKQIYGIAARKHDCSRGEECFDIIIVPYDEEEF